MTPPKDLADVVTGEFLLLSQKVGALLAEGRYSVPDAQDAYVSALIGHLFAILLTGIGPGLRQVNKSPEALAAALNILLKKMSAVAESLDRSADYRLQIFRREKSIDQGS